ncbi:MAG: Coenzyme F420 hydrogenase/dehydrogenase, beta subunit C-terminal domain [Promethearchaeota archaeon]
MAEYYLISYDDFNKLLEGLLGEKKLVSGIPKGNRFSIKPELVGGNTEKQEILFPLSQLFIYNFNRTDSASKFLQKYLSKQLQEGRLENEEIIVIGHPCDGRALMELSKRQQVNLDNIFLIIMEDIGIIPAGEVRKFLKKEEIDQELIVDEFLTEDKLYFKFKSGDIKEFKLGDKINIHENCSRCYRKKLDNYFDLSVTWITLDPFSKQLILRVGSDKGEKVLEDSKIEKIHLEKEKVKTLITIQEKLSAAAKEKRDNDLKNFLENSDRIKTIADCNMCGICINSCPVCFCVSCVLQKQHKEKTIDNLTYQLTRIAHVGDACVGCGKCDQNCPKGLPLSLYFQSVSEFVRQEFDYTAGFDMKPLPRSIQSINKGLES